MLVLVIILIGGYVLSLVGAFRVGEWLNNDVIGMILSIVLSVAWMIMLAIGDKPIKEG